MGKYIEKILQITHLAVFYLVVYPGGIKIRLEWNLNFHIENTQEII